MAVVRTPSEIRRRIDSTDPIAVLDIRPSLDYIEGHIRESTWVPRYNLERRVTDLVPDSSTPIVLVDNNGERANRDARWLETCGYENVSHLKGGVTAWQEEGFECIQAEGNVHATGFNYESKLFGEQVEATRDLSKIGPEELAERSDHTIIDVRNPEEYEKWGTIPHSVNIEGVDLPLYAEELQEDDEPLVVHCAGRTRSIIGAATLRELGVENVYELENGTMGWQLAGGDVVDGPGSPDDIEIDPERYDRLKRSAEQLLGEVDVVFDSPSELERIRTEKDRPVYVFDVRTKEEFEEGHLPGAVSVQGGQLIQTAERHIAVREAEIVLVSDTHIRAAVTAYWLNEMGYPNVEVLQEGITAWKESGRSLIEGSVQEAVGEDIVEATVNYVTPEEILDNSGAERIYVDALDSYAEGHVPESHWTSRYGLEETLEDKLCGSEVILTCTDGALSERAAAQLSTQNGHGSIAVLEGGVSSWREAGLEIEAGKEQLLREPREAIRKPYAQGTEEMEKYLDWEANLVEE